jgi:photosynthetic reaction center cytochrome c subunit
VQIGFRGVGQEQVYNVRKTTSGAELALNRVPKPVDKDTPSGQKASEAYQNVKVLRDVDVTEFNRLMLAMTEWVSPQKDNPEGCAYCHNLENLADESKYSYKVARRMIQMTQSLNVNWKQHVGNTGVTCYTCHRGNPVPKGIWFAPGVPHGRGMAGNDTGQNKPSMAVGLTSLPRDPFTAYLEREANIRVASITALPDGNRQTIKHAEWTYGLMMHMSQAMGVNCTYCHNTRNFSSWDQSSPQRSSAWYGIRMVRDINNAYITPLTPVFAGIAGRYGPAGDIGKANCATCHQGAYKPLYGVSMLPDYPDLGRITEGAQQVTLTPAVIPAPKERVESASLFRIEGKDSSGKKAAFDYIILTDDYTWVRGSAQQVSARGTTVPDADVAKRVIAPQLLSNLERATDLIAVGVASHEGEKVQEETRADQRAMTIAGWIKQMINTSAPLWKLNLGQYDKGCSGQQDADSSFQRPLMLAGVRAKDEGANLQEALADAISGKANLPSRACYSRFDMTKLK